MAKLINTEEINENGVEYIKEYYDSGATVKKLKPQPLPDDYVPPQAEPTEEEIYQAETLLMLAEISAKQNEQDKVLADLINQMEV